jgi:hypothetical protein
MIKYLFTGLSIGLFALSANVYADDRIYIDEEEFCYEAGNCWIHLGGNEWIRTETVHLDDTGLYTHECSIARFQGKDTPKPSNWWYEKHWKCPYCHKYWPQGKACKNENCPSRFK